MTTTKEPQARCCWLECPDDETTLDLEDGDHAGPLYYLSILPCASMRLLRLRQTLAPRASGTATATPGQRLGTQRRERGSIHVPMSPCRCPTGVLQSLFDRSDKGAGNGQWDGHQHNPSALSASANRCVDQPDHAARHRPASAAAAKRPNKKQKSKNTHWAAPVASTSDDASDQPRQPGVDGSRIKSWKEGPRGFVGGTPWTPQPEGCVWLVSKWQIAEWAALPSDRNRWAWRGACGLVGSHVAVSSRQNGLAADRQAAHEHPSGDLRSPLPSFSTAPTTCCYCPVGHQIRTNASPLPAGGPSNAARRRRTARRGSDQFETAVIAQPPSPRKRLSEFLKKIIDRNRMCSMTA